MLESALWRNQGGFVSVQSAILVGVVASGLLVGGVAYSSSLNGIPVDDDKGASGMCVTAMRVEDAKIGFAKGSCIPPTSEPVATATPTPAPAPTLTQTPTPSPTPSIVTPTPTPTPTVIAPPTVGNSAPVTNVQNVSAVVNGATSIVTSVDGSRLAAITSKKIFVSDNAGQSWKLLVDITTSIAGSNQSFASLISSKDGTSVLVGPSNTGSASSLYLYRANLATQNYVGAYSTNYGDAASYLSMDAADNGSKIIAARSDGFMYRSTSGGAYWTKASTQTFGVTKLASSADGVKIVAIAGLDTWRSNDSGVTWTKSTKVVPQKLISIDSDADGTKWFGTTSLGNVYYSTDMGVTWTPYEILGVPGIGQSWSNISVSSDGQVIVVGKYGKNGELLFSKDGGKTWNTSPALATSGYWTMVKVSPDGHRFFAQGSTLKTGVIE